jgi:hypothetical protein
MNHEAQHEEDLGDRYCSLLKSYYERLKADSPHSRSKVAIEEVKLRLFLSLLDRPTEQYRGESFEASPG